MQPIRSAGAFIREFWNMWGAHMSGAFSVPFAMLGAFVDSKYAPTLWLALAYAALALSAFLFWRRAAASEAKLKSTFVVTYDPRIPQCDAVPIFSDGTKSRCIRLRVENQGSGRLGGCEGWLESISELPTLGPIQLFWADDAGMGSVELTNRIPRFLQVFRLHESNRVIPATFMWRGNEIFPIDLLNAFAVGSTYRFRVGLKGNDDAATKFGVVTLEWNGDWETARVSYVEE